MKKTTAKSASRPAARAAVPTSDPTRRRNIRFKPDPGTLALIDFNSSDKGAFSPTMTCLVTEESFRGAGLVGLTDARLAVGARFRVAVGRANPAVAEVRWVSHLDSQVTRVGIMYVDLD